MELDLKEIGQTLAIGALAVFGLFAIIQMFRRSVLVDLVVKLLQETVKNKLSGAQHHIFLGAVYLALIFAFGITLEDLSKNLASERSPRVFDLLYQGSIPADKELRIETLFESTRSGSRHPVESNDARAKIAPSLKGKTVWPISLAYDLASSDLLVVDELKATYSSQMVGNACALQELLKKNAVIRNSAEDVVGLEVDSDELETIVNQLYYRAHNEVYLHTDAGPELDKISTRMDFARAMLFASFSLESVLALLFLYYLGETSVWYLRSYSQKGTKPSSQPRRARQWTVAAVLLCVALAWLRHLIAWEGTPLLSVAIWWLILVAVLYSLSEWPLGAWIDRRYPRNLGVLDRTLSWKLVQQAFLMGLVLGIFAFLGKMSFISESESYNLRVFGYYQTLGPKVGGMRQDKL